MEPDRPTVALPNLRPPRSGSARIDGKPASKVVLTIHMSEETEVLLHWICLSYSMTRSMLVNQMVAWAWYTGRADTAIVKWMKKTGDGRIDGINSSMVGSFPGDSANRMGALWQRALPKAEKHNPNLLERMDRHFDATWSPVSLVVNAVFGRYQRMFADLCRFRPDACDGKSAEVFREKPRHHPYDPNRHSVGGTPGTRGSVPVPIIPEYFPNIQAVVDQ